MHLSVDHRRDIQLRHIVDFIGCDDQRLHQAHPDRPLQQDLKGECLYLGAGELPVYLVQLIEDQAGAAKVPIRRVED